MVEYIQYKDNKYPVRISYYAIKEFQIETGKDISQVEDDLTNLEILLWYGLVAGHRAADKKLEVKRDEVEFILDESFVDFNKIIVTSFAPKTDSEESEKGVVKKN